MDFGEERADSFLPRFGSLMQDMGFAPAMHGPFVDRAASLASQKDRGSFPVPSMIGGAGVQGGLLALVASQLFSFRCGSIVSAAPIGFDAGHSFT